MVGAVLGNYQLLDWTATGIDPLADDARSVLARPWSITGGQWNPTVADASAMLAFLGTATDTEVDVVTGGPAPNLEIAEITVDGGTCAPASPMHSSSGSSTAARARPIA